MTIAHGMSNEQYRASAGLSHSEAKLLRMKTPYHVYMLREHPSHIAPRKPSPQMILGSAVHCAVLEPTTFDQRYCADLDASRNSNAYREFAQQCADFGLIPLDDDTRERVFAMRDSLLHNEQIADALSVGKAEVSAWWADPASSVACKCRPDFVRPTGNGSLLVDLKTSSDASPDMFARSIATFGYHTQCDWYTDGYARAAGHDVHGMLFVVVESEFPFACAAYTLDDAALTEAHRLNERVRRTYAQCSASGIWPGYGDAVRDISLPRWAYSREEEITA